MAQERIDIQIPDAHNTIFCAKHLQRQAWTDQKMHECFTDCPFYAGSAQGQGVECYYDPDILKTNDPKPHQDTRRQEADRAQQYAHYLTVRTRADELARDGHFQNDEA